MAKSLPNNMCRMALINGKLVCKGKDLLTKCENWSRELRIQNVTKGCLDANSLKKAAWDKNEEYLKALVLARPKIKDRYSDNKNKRDKKSRFRMRSRILRIKAKR